MAPASASTESRVTVLLPRIDREDILLVVDNALSVLRAAFREVEGVIVNGQRVEASPQVLCRLQR